MTQLWEILVPTHDNDGKKIRLSHHHEWDSKVESLCGGLTILKAAKGRWRHKGKLFAEKMIPVRIVCSKVQIEVIAKLTQLHYKQIQVMYFLVSEQVMFYPNDIEKD